MTEFTFDIVESLREEPERWDIGPYRARHDTGLQLQYFFSRLFLHIDSPFILRLPWRRKRAIWAALQHAKRRKVTKMLIYPIGEEPEII